MYKRYIKRVIDIFAGFIGLLITLPILIAFGVILTITNGGNPLFFQNRPGINGKIFRIIKFRTMSNKRNSKGELFPDAERLHKIGKFVRSTSIDELPQMINVLKGDMSFIGPRPLLVEYLPLYSKEQAKRHNVRPGITGWAQVNGRNAISWEQKFNFDIFYVDNMSMLLDIKIVFMTIKKIICRSDISSKTTVTMEVFNGKN